MRRAVPCPVPVPGAALMMLAPVAHSAVFMQGPAVIVSATAAQSDVLARGLAIIVPAFGNSFCCAQGWRHLYHDFTRLLDTASLRVYWLFSGDGVLGLCRWVVGLFVGWVRFGLLGCGLLRIWVVG